MLLCTACIPRLYGEEHTWEPPDNSWYMSEPPTDLLGEGWGPGQIAPDFRLMDQFGDTVSLWQFHGQVVLLDISTIWCAPCQELARHTEATWQDYRDQGFIYLTVLQEDVEGGPVELEDILAWVDLFGISAPVLEDSTKAATGSAIKQGIFPAVLIIGRDLRVIERVNPVEEKRVRQAIERALAEG